MKRIIESGNYNLKETKKWLIWLAVFGIVGYLILKTPPFIPPAVAPTETQSFGDPYHADLIRVD